MTSEDAANEVRLPGGSDNERFSRFMLTNASRN